MWTFGLTVSCEEVGGLILTSCIRFPTLNKKKSTIVSFFLQFSQYVGGAYYFDENIFIG